MTYADYKVQYREVPPGTPSVMGCMAQLFIILVILAFIGLATWIAMFFISKT
jgi:hypothetical protein